MDPTIAITVLSKLIGLGLSSKGALKSSDFDADDLSALQTFLDTGVSFASMRASPSPERGARQLGLITHAFGQAFGRHWHLNGQFVPRGGLRRFWSKAEKNRSNEIEARTRAAALRLTTPGDREAGPEELALVDSLGGNPLDTPYYRALWDAYADPDPLLLGAEGGDPPLLMTDTTRREFERHFLLAYWEALASPAGSGVGDYVGDLREYRALIVRDLLLEDMASWGGRHVFGNTPRHRLEQGYPLPFLPLEEMYVEPDAVRERDGKLDGKAAPILGMIERILSEPRAHVVVVKADFGSGKSLTTRTLAMRCAARYLTTRAASGDVWLPVFLRCADDFPGDGFQLEPTVRRAWKRQAADFDLSLRANDDALKMPSDPQRTVFLLDGLDEVALGARSLESFFERLLEDATDRHRFVIFSRPGALPVNLEKKGIVVVQLMPLQQASGDTQLAGATDGPAPQNQIALWLDRWNRVSGRREPITVAKLRERGLLEIAGTPILLLMIAHTWDAHPGRDVPASLAEIYEDFFWHVARGKHEADREQHRTVFDASVRLLEALKARGELDEGAKAPDAMLWLMGRVAWEARKLGQQTPPALLKTRHVDNLVEKEVEIEDAEEAIRTIRVGLLLAMQADLETRADHILFGHKSFLEFLVARYWAARLRKIIGARERERAPIEVTLRGGRLLSENDKCFRFLMEMINSAPVGPRPSSPLGWTDDERRELVAWCQDQFESEEQDFGKFRPMALRSDQRAPLREAALAIGSTAKGSDGLIAKDSRTLRSMIAWFWLVGREVLVIAPNAQLCGADLNGAILGRADLRRADLTKANFNMATLWQNNCHQAKLQGAILGYARLTSMDLSAADLRGVFADDAIFDGSTLESALLDGGSFTFASFNRCNLESASLIKADLMGASFPGANLGQANLGMAHLDGSNLSTAYLGGTIFTGAFYNDDTQWPVGFDPSAAGAIARGVNR